MAGSLSELCNDLVHPVDHSEYSGDPLALPKAGSGVLFTGQGAGSFLFYQSLE